MRLGHDMCDLIQDTSIPDSIHNIKSHLTNVSEFIFHSSDDLFAVCRDVWQSQDERSI